jgi:nicotinamidase-related amidase
MVGELLGEFVTVRVGAARHDGGMSRALVVIDVQNSFLFDPLWSANSNPNIVASVNRLVDGARAAGDAVIWVLHGEPGSGGEFDPASGHVRLMDGLEALPGEPTVVKNMHNAFTTTSLQLLLTSQGIRHLTICGIRTEQCVETTARLACDLGYEVDFVLDATVTTPREHWDAPVGRTADEILADPRTLSTEMILERVGYALSGRFARICSVDQVVSEWQA